MFCSSYVKHHAGVSTAVFDMGIENNPWQILPKILKLTQPKVVAMTCTTPMFREIRLIGMFAKTVLGKNIIVVHGGVHPSALPDESLNETMCDIVVQPKVHKGEYGPVEDAHLIINHIIAYWFHNKLK